MDYEAPGGGFERYRLPLLLAGGLTLYGASRLDATRPVAGLLLTYGFPVIALAWAAAPFRESSLLRPVLAVGGVCAAAAELAIGRALAPEAAVFGLIPEPVLMAVSIGSMLAAAFVQAKASGRGMPPTFSAWMGMVTMIALYMPSHARVGKDSLDAFVAALLVSLFVGGGAGLALGALAARVFKRPEAKPAISRPKLEPKGSGSKSKLESNKPEPG
jgi:hypothetical protein